MLMALLSLHRSSIRSERWQLLAQELLHLLLTRLAYVLGPAHIVAATLSVLATHLQVRQPVLFNLACLTSQLGCRCSSSCMCRAAKVLPHFR